MKSFFDKGKRFVAILLIVVLAVSAFPLGAAAKESAENGMLLYGRYFSETGKIVIEVALLNNTADVDAAVAVLKYDTSVLNIAKSDVKYLNGAIESMTYCDTEKGYVGADWYYTEAVTASENATRTLEISFSFKSGKSIIDMKENSISLCTAQDAEYLNTALPGYGNELGLLLCDGEDCYSLGQSTAFADLEIPLGNRLAGMGRFDTAVSISKEGWENGSSIAILAYGMNYADALAGVPLAAAFRCPILLTENPASGLEKIVTDEMARLGVKKVYILGGEYVISKSIENTLTGKYGKDYVIRLNGMDRYGTSLAIAKELYRIRKERGMGGFSKMYFCSAGSFADALAISPVAGVELNPILYAPAYVNGADCTFGAASPETVSYVKEMKADGCKNTTVIGGIYAVSEAAESDLKKIMGAGSVERVDAGKTGGRYETMLEICKKYDSVFKSDDTICVATGANFPDALSGAALAAKLGCPMILVGYKDAQNKVSSIGTQLQEYVATKQLKDCFVFGGVYAVPDSQIELLTKK
ncbi:MAG: cell wall-binding repeat-containing protein [Clostridia bacterium]|nr:cell wall-binding repeat-containing protein [Clostridia bacterium]